MIRLDQISFGYCKDKKLFGKLNLVPGHIYGLLGKNGVGKSSMLRNLVGLLFLQKGKLIFAVCKPRKLHLPSVTAEQHLDMIAPFYPKFDQAKFSKDIVDTDILENNKLMEISFGPKNKILIAFTLAAITRILIINGEDIPSKGQSRKLISAAGKNKLILISTHQVRALSNLIDSIIIILTNSKVLPQCKFDTITECLCFGTSSTADDDDRVIYSESSLLGYKAAFESSEREENPEDFEQLFNAAMENSTRMQKFNY